MLEQIKRDQEKKKIADAKVLEKPDLKLLMSPESAAEQAVLRSMGLDHNLKVATELLGKRIDQEKFENQYNKTILTFEEIQKVAEQYRLFLKPAKLYIGNIPPDLAKEMVEFSKEQHLNLDGTRTSYEFYILAPPNMFSNYKGVHFDDVKLPKMPQFSDPDPCLFMKIEHSRSFILLKQWGDTLLPFRRVYGAITDKPWKIFSFNVIALIGLITFMSVFQIFAWVKLLTYNYTTIFSHIISIIIGFILVGLAIILIIAIIVYWLDSSNDGILTDKTKYRSTRTWFEKMYRGSSYDPPYDEK